MKPTELDILEVWAVFYIWCGDKFFITELSDITRLGIREAQAVKYSHPKVLKFTKEKALKIAKKNKTIEQLYGVVNNLGQQETI